MGLRTLLNSLSVRYTRRYLVTRAANTLLVFFVVLLINFFLPRMMPGNFADIYVQQLIMRNHGIDPEILANRIYSLFGLNLPLYDQLLRYLHEIVSISPDFGPSFGYYPTPSWTIVLFAAKWSLLLLGTSQAISWTIGIFLGIYLALHKNKFIDRLMLPAMYFVDTIPYFWLAMIFILVFAVELRVLPAGQAYTMYPTPTSILGHMILPVLTVVIGSLFHHAIVVRSSAIDIISSDFVQVMKAQGLRRRTFLGRVLRNSLLPSLTQLFLSMGLLIGGIFTIEYAFSYPGLGMVIADAALNRDYPVLQAALYLTTLVVLLSNLLADLTYPLADPRVSYVG